MHDRLLVSKLGALALRLVDEAEARLAPQSESTASALLSLLHRSSLTVTELASVLQLAQPSVTRLIDKLEQGGLIKRLTPSGKRVPVALSTKGQAAAQAIQDNRLGSFADFCAVLDDAERAALDGILSKLLAVRVTSRRHARHICRQCDHAVCDGPSCPVGCAAAALDDKGSRNVD